MAADTTVIPLSKVKLFGLAFGAALFVAAGCWMLGMDAAEIEQQRRFNSPWFVHGLGFAGAIFGVVGFVGLLRKALSPAPGLVLDARGLTDNSSVFPGGFIPWSGIEGFEVGQINRQRMLYVVLKDPEAFIAGFGPLRRMLLRANMRLAASPVAITSNSLRINFDELVRLVQKHHAASLRGH